MDNGRVTITGEHCPEECPFIFDFFENTKCSLFGEDFVFDRDPETKNHFIPCRVISCRRGFTLTLDARKED